MQRCGNESLDIFNLFSKRKNECLKLVKKKVVKIMKTCERNKVWDETTSKVTFRLGGKCKGIYI